MSTHFKREKLNERFFFHSRFNAIMRLNGIEVKLLRIQWTQFEIFLCSPSSWGKTIQLFQQPFWIIYAVRTMENLLHIVFFSLHLIHTILLRFQFTKINWIGAKILCVETSFRALNFNLLPFLNFSLCKRFFYDCCRLPMLLLLLFLFFTIISLNKSWKNNDRWKRLKPNYLASLYDVNYKFPEKNMIRKMNSPLRFFNRFCLHFAFHFICAGFFVLRFFSFFRFFNRTFLGKSFLIWMQLACLCKFVY